MKQNLGKYNSFTLVELLVVTIIIGIVVPIIIEVYLYFIKSNKEVVARQTAIQQGFEFFERLNILMQDYTVDYEEYYNRQMVGCVNSGGLYTGNNFKWNIGLSGYCTEFTAYGNENSTDKKTELSMSTLTGKYHNIYYCSSLGSKNESRCPRIVMKSDCGKLGVRQSFGQYKTLFVDVKKSDSVMNTCGIGDDDEDLGNVVASSVIEAIRDDKNIQELYLISHDGKRRLYFRRKLVDHTSNYAQYKIQMLRLRGFDAGIDHNYDSSDNEGLYDGQIDTWACDASMGFSGHGASVGGAYSEYHLPDGVDDCWIDLTYGNTNIYTRNISISPLGDPELFWADQNRQINPYMKIFMVNGVYLPEYADGNSVGSSILNFKVPIETTINMKDFYKE